MLAIAMSTLYRARYTLSRLARQSCFRKVSTQSRRPPVDESTLGGAQHKPSLSGPSLGHLISELSATTPEMIKQGLRKEGQTMAEDQRTFARRITLGVMGVPVVIGTGIVAWNWLLV